MGHEEMAPRPGRRACDQRRRLQLRAADDAARDGPERLRSASPTRTARPRTTSTSRRRAAAPDRRPARPHAYAHVHPRLQATGRGACRSPSPNRALPRVRRLRENGHKTVLAATSSSPVTCMPTPRRAEDAVAAGPYTVPAWHAIHRAFDLRSRGRHSGKLENYVGMRATWSRCRSGDLAYTQRAPARVRRPGHVGFGRSSRLAPIGSSCSSDGRARIHRAVHGRGAAMSRVELPIEGIGATCASRIERKAEQARRRHSDGELSRRRSCGRIRPEVVRPRRSSRRSSRSATRRGCAGRGACAGRGGSDRAASAAADVRAA